MAAISTNIAYALLLQSIQTDEQSATSEARCILEQEQVNWEDFLYLAACHEVRPAAYALLKRLPAEIVPPEVTAQLQAAQREIAVQQMAMAGEFLRVRKHLEKAGVLAVPFKGFWLAHSAYGHIAGRECVDVDLFIRRRDFHEIAKVMYGLGYQPPAGMQQLKEDYIFKHLGDFSFDKVEHGRRLFHFEFHWNLGNFKYSMDVSLEHLEGHLEKRAFHGQEIDVFSPSANLLLAALHHGGKESWIKLKQVQDIVQVLHHQGTHLNWDWITAQVQRLGAKAVLLTGLGLANELGQVPVPGSLLEATSSAGIRQLIAGRMNYLAHPQALWENGYYLNRLWFHLRTRSRLFDQFRMLKAFAKGVIRQALGRLFTAKKT